MTINRPQRQKLAQFVAKMGFDVAVLAVDRAMVHGANSAAYPLAILEEWDRLGLHDLDAVDAHLEGEAIA
ncbi:MAG: hypothetical protein LUG44_03690 [Clostridiales bacterium]|nr:hypothetical protein [Clostridiales bacterium]